MRYLLILPVLLPLSVVLDIPILRPLLVVVCLGFLPGWLILEVLHLGYLSLSERVALSVGLSICLTIILGGLTNKVLLALGYTSTLTVSSLLTILEVSLAVLVLTLFIRSRKLSLHLSRLLLQSLLPVSLVILSLCLLVPYALSLDISQLSDTKAEYYLFSQVLDNQNWIREGNVYTYLDQCLSISLLPAVFQILSGIESELVFKVLPPILVSFLPLILYSFYSRVVRSPYAFLASLFLISQIYFLWTAICSRTNIAVLLFASVLLVAFRNGISPTKKILLVILLTGGVVLSHYGVTFGTFYLLVVWLILEIVRRIFLRKLKSSLPVSTIVVVLLVPLLATGLLWHGIVSDRTLKGMVSFSRDTVDIDLRDTVDTDLVEETSVVGVTTNETEGTTSEIESPTSLDKLPNIVKPPSTTPKVNPQAGFLSLDSREPVVQVAFGKTWPILNLPQRIEFILSWLLVAIMSLGLLVSLIQSKIDWSYLTLSIVCYLFVVGTVLLPTLSVWYGIARVHFQMLVVLAIYLVPGSVQISRWIRINPVVFLLPLLVVYLLCTTGTLYLMFGVTR